MDGAVSHEQAVKLRQCLDHIDKLVSHRAQIESEIRRIVSPFTAALDLIHTVPGFDKNPMTAITVIAEIGVDMSVFPSAKNLVSWAGCCPRNDQSGGKIQVRFDIPKDALQYGYAPDVKMRLSGDKLRGLGWEPELDLPQMYQRLIASWQAQEAAANKGENA